MMGLESGATDTNTWLNLGNCSPSEAPQGPGGVICLGRENFMPKEPGDGDR